MKISNIKKQLAKIISENGGWRDGCEWSVQNGEHGRISFSENKPVRQGAKSWVAGGGFQFKIEVCKPLSNWHQCILSREEYFHLYPAPDAKTEFCESVMRSIPEPEIHSKNTALTQVDDINVVELKPTIEQLAAEYRNSKNYADLKQQEAGAAKADAEAKMAELVAAGKAIGLVVSVETTESKCPDGVMQITKRSQLEIGDVIRIGRSGVKEDERRLPEGEYQVVKVGTIGVLHNGSTFYPDFSFRSWRFIRRP